MYFAHLNSQLHLYPAQQISKPVKLNEHPHRTTCSTHPTCGGTCFKFCTRSMKYDDDHETETPVASLRPRVVFRGMVVCYLLFVTWTSLCHAIITLLGGNDFYRSGLRSVVLTRPSLMPTPWLLPRGRTGADDRDRGRSSGGEAARHRGRNSESHRHKQGT